MESKHVLEGGIARNLFFFEIDANEIDALPSRHHIFNNGVFIKRQYIMELAVALIQSSLKIYLRTTKLVRLFNIFL